MKRRSWAEPWKIKVVEPIRMTSRPERETAAREAGYNTFLMRSEDVYIDLLTDSGTSAMSDNQWAGMMVGDEAYAGSRSYYDLVDSIDAVYGYEELIPTHQGRGAEHILSQILIKAGDFVPGNMYFTTTRFHQEHAGGTFVDVIIDEAHDPSSLHPFKGNVDLGKLQQLIDEVGAERIPYISVETNVNMAGGQPLSMANLRATYELCKRNGILLMLDATRALENAWFIQQREPGYGEKRIAQIVREICDLSDGATVSSKKDNLVNIGGFLALRDEDLARKARNLVVVFEGLHTYGGMSGRDMEALARGIREMVETDDHVRARVGQVEYLGEALIEAGVPIIRPVGGHGVFIDARAVLPHIPQDQFPAQALAAALYVGSGVRGMERGVVSAGRNKSTGDHNYPKLELLRLTIPRRVYTQAHMDVTAEAVVDLLERPETVQGLRFTFEPQDLRFFQARFEPVA
jgi:tyrosine phenol-lyase